MKFLRISLLLLITLSFTNCFEDRDDNLVAGNQITDFTEIKDFVWKGMNAVYLYKENVPDLANNRFSSDIEYTNYLNSFDTPETLFESLIFNRETVDRFSVIIPNYIEFELAQSGTSLSNGLEYNFYYKPGSTTDIFGVIRLVLNNSFADNLGLERGQIFDAVNGTPLTINNANSLINQDIYTLNFAVYNDNGTEMTEDDTIVSTGNSVQLIKEVYTENPVHIANVIEVDGENVGYLMYNGFNSSFNNELNAAFALFQANNVQHLVLDLRYNPGGSVLTASYLGSMVTGQFNGDIYSKLVYNNDLQVLNTEFPFVNNIDGNNIFSLNLNKVYVLTSNRSASASELVINSLSSYIDVVQIGDSTVGKTQASITVYDSPDLSPNNVNPGHTYAMQPLVANSVNVNDEAVPADGLPPFIPLIESARNFGTLGDINEPLLAAAIADIQSPGRFNYSNTNPRPIKIDISNTALEETMYINSDIIFNGLPTNQ